MPIFFIFYCEKKNNKNKKLIMQQKIVSLGVNEFHPSIEFINKETPINSQNLPTNIPQKNKINNGQIIKTNPTIGANLEEFTYNNVKFQAWDLGGQESIRSIWDAYYMNTDAIIYVIDSKNEENLEESREQFHKVLKNQSLKNCIILFFVIK